MSTVNSVESVDVECFISELETVMQRLEETKRQVEHVRMHAVDGKIPLYGMFSWRVILFRMRSLEKNLQKSWPLVVAGDKANEV
jgi:hypothetical protein